MDYDEDEEVQSKIGDINITRSSHKVTPSFLTTRREDTAVVGSDFVKYMVDPNIGMGTLIFYRRYVTPRKEAKGWSVDTIVEESFLEVKVPLNTLFALALDLSTVVQQIQKNPRGNITYFGPSSVRQEQKKTDGS